MKFPNYYCDKRMFVVHYFTICTIQKKGGSLVIDIHCHILPNLDDGAHDLDTAIAMCKIAVENNISKVIATPHFEIGNDIDEFISLRDSALIELRKAISKEHISLEILPGVEVAVSDNLFFAKELEKLRLADTSYILTEYSFTGLTQKRLFKYFDEIEKYGLKVIIAHPERYKYFQDDYKMINALRDRGVLFQVNVGSLLGNFGPREFKLAKQMCLTNCAFFIASDAHTTRVRSNALLSMCSSISRFIPSAQLKWMLEEAPGRLLKNDNFSSVKSEIIRKKLF